MPYPYRTCSRQLHHSQTHGPQSHPKGPRKGLSPLKAQSRRLGRRLPCEPHRRMIPSPDSPAGHSPAILAISTIRTNRSPISRPSSPCTLVPLSRHPNRSSLVLVLSPASYGILWPLTPSFEH